MAWPADWESVACCGGLALEGLGARLRGGLAAAADPEPVSVAQADIILQDMY